MELAATVSFVVKDQRTPTLFCNDRAGWHSKKVSAGMLKGHGSSQQDGWLDTQRNWHREDGHCGDVSESVGRVRHCFW